MTRAEIRLMASQMEADMENGKMMERQEYRDYYEKKLVEFGMWIAAWIENWGNIPANPAGSRARMAADLRNALLESKS